ncbi:MAG: integrin alpha [Myxococcota bacterium]
MITLLLAACTEPEHTAPPDDETDIADTAPDTSDTTDTAEPPSLLGAHTWAATLDEAPDLRISACGTTHDGPFPLAVGTDLDGDGLDELVVGVPGHDAVFDGVGAVYFFRGVDLAAAPSLEFSSAWARVVHDRPDAHFGGRVQWVGDRDGDSVEDLLAWTDDYTSFATVVSGADLLAGGDLTPGTLIEAQDLAVARWDDLDGDGRDDWLFAYEGEFDSASVLGLTTVLDPDFGADGGAVTHGAALVGLGGVVRVLDQDLDGDGLREFVTEEGRDLVIVGSAAFLAGAEDVVLDRYASARSYVESAADLLDLGDLDGGGANELLFSGDDRLCVTHGEAADRAGAPFTCVRSADAEPPSAVASGADLDGDGVREVWAQLADALVAWDGASLLAGIRLERARIDHAGRSTEDTLATDEDGAIWASSPDDGWVSTASVWRFAALDGVADATPALVPSHSGRDPGHPVWVDLTGDALDDLVFLDDRLTLFDGTRLAGGGDLTMCEADVSIDLGVDDPTFVDDLDGDSIPELLSWTSHDHGLAYHVRSGAHLGDTAHPDLTTWAADVRLDPLGCDLDGDGRDDLFQSFRTVTTLYAGTLASTGDVTGALLGALEGEGPRCIPDVDGDARAELFVLQDGTFTLFLSSQLDPARVLGTADAWATLTDTSSPEWRGSLSPGDLDEDGVPDTFFFASEQVETRPVSSLCTLAPTLLTTGGPIDITTATCGAPWLVYGDTFTVAHAIGDDRADLMVLYLDPLGDTVFAAIEDVGMGQPVPIARLRDGDYTSGGFGPDVLGTGAPSLCATTSHAEARATFEMVFARLP